MDDQTSERLFEALESKLAALEPPDAMHFARDKWPLVFLLVGFGLTLGANYLGPWSVWLMLLGVTLEFSAFGVLVWCQSRDVVPEFFDAKRKFAIELDKDFLDIEGLRHWLRQVPASDRERRLKFAEDRLNNFTNRFPLIFGPVDKLGLLPVLLGLFFQVQSFQDFSLWQTVLGIGILVLYFMAFWMFRFRLQLERYARLIRSVDDLQHGS